MEIIDALTNFTCPSDIYSVFGCKLDNN